MLGEYGVPPERFARQLDRLGGDGWRSSTSSASSTRSPVVRRCRQRSLLLTFDDAYVDLLTAACPILFERSVPAVAFAVDRPHRRDERLAAKRGAGAAVARCRRATAGARSRGRRRLARCDAPAARRGSPRTSSSTSSTGSADSHRVARPLHGRPSSRIRTASGARASQRRSRPPAIAPRSRSRRGAVRRLADRYALPRIEVLASDTDRNARAQARRAGAGAREADLRSAPPPGDLQPGPTPTFSIVIAAYQAASHDRRVRRVCTRADGAGSRGDRVDDGSTDGTADRLAPYRDRIVYSVRRIRVRRQRQRRSPAGDGRLRDDPRRRRRVRARSRLDALAELARLVLISTSSRRTRTSRSTGRTSAASTKRHRSRRATRRLAIFERCFVAWPAVRRTQIPRARRLRRVDADRLRLGVLDLACCTRAAGRARSTSR